MHGGQFRRDIRVGDLVQVEVSNGGTIADHTPDRRFTGVFHGIFVGTVAGEEFNGGYINYIALVTGDGVVHLRWERVTAGEIVRRAEDADG